MKNKLSPDWSKLTLQQKICAIFQRTYQRILHIFSKLAVSLKKKQNYNGELRYYKTRLGYVPFNPKTFNEDFNTIEKVLKSDYYKHKTKNITNEHDKVNILKNILLINYCSRTTYETFKKK